MDPDRSEVARGHLLMTSRLRKTTYAAVVDGCGAAVWWAPADSDAYAVNRARLGADGASVLLAQYHQKRAQDVAVIRRYDFDGTMLSETATRGQHHDFVELGNGEFAWLAFTFQEDVWFGGGANFLLSDAIYAAPEGTMDRADHRVIFDLADASQREPWWTCEHMQSGLWVGGTHDWSHSNSLIRAPDGDGFLVMVRHWDEVLRINEDGSVRWTLGASGDLKSEPGTILPRHAHMSMYAEDRLWVFDNRNHTPDATRAVEYEIDEVRGTVRERWSYAYPNGDMLDAMGDVRLLPGGNVLIIWGVRGEMEEVTRDGDVVWRATKEGQIGKVTFLPEGVWPE